MHPTPISYTLRKPLQVECDGKPLELPEDIEGILLLNINSYMGGVNLWASGAGQPGRQASAKQSICDGYLEVAHPLPSIPLHTLRSNMKSGHIRL